MKPLSLSITQLSSVAILLVAACGGSIEPVPGGGGPGGGGGGAGTSGSGTSSGAAGGGTGGSGGATSGGSDGTSRGASSGATSPIPSFTVPPSDLDFYGGSEPGGYSSSVDTSTTVDGAASTLLVSGNTANDDTWNATVGNKSIDSSYWGKRWRMRTKIKTESADGGFAWFRIDLPNGYVIDNMIDPTDRTISGTKDWQEVSLVLDVPNDATDFAFGSGLMGKGKVWIGPITFDEVNSSINTTPHAYGGTKP